MPPPPSPPPRPPRFVHPDYTHPYGRLVHPFTPVRWLLYLATAAIAWIGVVPGVILFYAIRCVLTRMVRCIDAISKPRVTMHGAHRYRHQTALAEEEQESCDKSMSIDSIRLIPTAPSDRMWLDRGDLNAPGTSAACLIHAILVFDQPITIESLSETFRTRITDQIAFERFTQIAIRRVTQRWWLPRCVGDEEEFFWLRSSSFGRSSGGAAVNQIDIANHIRSVPWSTWAEHPLTDETRGRPKEDVITQEYHNRNTRANTAEPMINNRRHTGDITSQTNDSEEHQYTNHAFSSSPSSSSSADPSSSLRLARLQSYLSDLSSTPLAAGMPLWEMIILEPEPPHAATSPFYASHDEDEGAASPTASPPTSADECVIVFRCSHALADGVLLSGIILKTFLQEIVVEAAKLDTDRSGGAQLSPPTGIAPHTDPDGGDANSSVRASSVVRRPKPSCGEKLLGMLGVACLMFRFVLTGPYLLFHKSFQPDGENILHAPPTPTPPSSVHTGGEHNNHTDVSKKRICWSTHGFPLTRVKQVSKLLGVTLNDLVMAIWLEVIDEYMQASESSLRAKLLQSPHPTRSPSHPPVLRQSLCAPDGIFVLVPFNVRSQRESEFGPHSRAKLGNKFAVLMVDLPMGRSIRPTTNDANHQPDTIARAQRGDECDDDERHATIDVNDEIDADGVGQPDEDGSSTLLASSARLPKKRPHPRLLSSRSSNPSPASIGVSSLVGVDGPNGDPPPDVAPPFMRRLHYLSSFMAALKVSPEPIVMYRGIEFMIQYLPRTIANYILDIYSGLCSIVITNNRSPAQPLYLIEPNPPPCSPSSASPASCGVSESESSPVSAPRRLLYWVSWAPQRSAVGICVTIITYNGELRVSVVADERCIRYTNANSLVRRYQEKLTQLIHEAEQTQTQ